jgi:SAD/SRA domain/SET domain/Pre-SET motif
MMQERSRNYSDVPSANNLKRKSISAVHHLPPGWGSSPQPRDVSVTNSYEELDEGEITPEEMPHHEEKNSDFSYKAVEAIKEGHAGNFLVIKGQNGKSVIENDGVSDQWWMRSKVYPPPKRRLVSAFRRYPEGCGRNLGLTVAGFNSKRVQHEKMNGINEAILGKDAETVSDGAGGTNGNSKKVGYSANLVDAAGCMNVVEKHARNGSFRGNTKLVRDLEGGDVSLSVMVTGVKRATLQAKAKDRDGEGQKVDCKVSSCAEPNTFKGKGVSVNNNSAEDSIQNKVVKPIKVKIRYKAKKEEGSKTILPLSGNPSERDEEILGSSNMLATRKSPLKVIAKKQVGIKHPVSNYTSNFPRINRHASGNADIEEYASHAIRQSRTCPSRLPARKSGSALYHIKSEINHGKKVANKSVQQPHASSSGLNVYRRNTACFGPKDDRPSDPRAKVKRCLHLFQIISRKLLQEVESGKRPADVGRNRIDLRTACILGELKETLNRDKPVVGSVPGVEVGDEYRYRAELSVLGLHRPPQAGIDSTKWKGICVAISIVASGGYSDGMENENVLIYTGSGGKPTGKPGHTVPADQKLERGNLALKNSIDMKTPVRVIHGQSTSDASKVVMTFTYDGLYKVVDYWRDTETYMVKGKPMAAIVFRFRLERLEGQPDLNWSKLKKIQRSKLREGLCSKDISLGSEKLPICVINTIDNEKLRQFRYITKTVYPSWYQKRRPNGCKCNGRCSDATSCSCAAKNGGEIPFNFNRAIVQAKPLIYECGPMCGCPPSCYNRVSQHGIKFPLEVFKTGKRGWGVRSLCSIPSGSFVCEYIGELLRDEEAEQRKNDEYLFDIGHNYDDSALWEGLPSNVPGLDIRLPSTDERANSSEADEQEGFSLDAHVMGNVGRFINHSCLPNLYAQNVLFDHDDKKMPHIMFFAAENIPPLEELTYHYNYTVGSVRDSDGNVKIKECYCGSSECRGRLY